MVRWLPSVASPEGTDASGPADVQVQGRCYTVALGLGAEPDLRAQLPRFGQKLGTVSTGRFGRPGLRVVADIAAYEDAVNPDGTERDSNPTALLQRGRRAYVVDAGGQLAAEVPTEWAREYHGDLPGVGGAGTAPSWDCLREQ